MSRYGLLTLIALLISFPIEAADLSKSWFQPELEVNNSPICEILVSREKSIWSNNIDKSDFHRLFKYAFEAKVKINGELIYITTYSHPGCGGACETYQILASKTPFPLKREQLDFYDALLGLSPPSGDNSVLLSSNEGRYYALTENDDSDQFYELKEDAGWEHLCTVKKKPSKEQIKKIEADGSFLSIQSSLKELRGLIGELRGGAGNCGTLKSHTRGKIRVDQEFERLLYVPRLEPKIKTRYNGNSYGNDLKNLKIWSLEGLSEFKAFSQYEDKFPIVLNDLVDFYKRNFDWDEEKSRKIAHYALTYAVSSGLWFGLYEPFETKEEIELRIAILHRKPIEEIKQININSINRATIKGDWYSNRDSILNIAMNYPEALAYLLEVGFDPNTKNNFNKTPLMYAAQQNNYESAKLLIDSGANINTGTIIPADHCRYTLRTANMSPLHYAVRYADKNLINLLLDSGASIFFDVENKQGHRAVNIEYPIDWLKRFSNSNLSAEDRVEIKKRLTFPGDSIRRSMAEELNLEGKSLYKRKNYKLANQKFKEATHIDSENYEILNNFALASLKIGDKGRALESFRKIIDSVSSTGKQKSSAYFNTGLACDLIKSSQKRYGLRFNRKSYCRGSSFYNYIEHYEKNPSESTGFSLIEKFKQRQKRENYCVAKDKRFDAIFSEGRHFYFLHRKSIDDIALNLQEVASEESMKSLAKVYKNRKLLLKRKLFSNLNNGYFVSLYLGNFDIKKEFLFNKKACENIN